MTAAPRSKGLLLTFLAVALGAAILALFSKDSAPERAPRRDRDSGSTRRPDPVATDAARGGSAESGAGRRESHPPRESSQASVTVLLPDHETEYEIDGTLFIARIGKIRKWTVPIVRTTATFRVDVGDYKIRWMVAGLGVHSEPVSIRDDRPVEIDFRSVTLAEYDPLLSWARVEVRVQGVDGAALESVTVEFLTLTTGGRSLRRTTNEVGKCFAYVSPAPTKVRCGSFATRVAAAAGATHTVEIPGAQTGEFGDVSISGNMDLRIRPRGGKRWCSQPPARSGHQRRFALLKPGPYEFGLGKTVLGGVQVKPREVVCFSPRVGRLVLRPRFGRAEDAADAPDLVYLRVTRVSGGSGDAGARRVGWLPKRAQTVVVGYVEPGVYRIESADRRLECQVEHSVQAGVEEEVDVPLRPVG